MPLSIRITVLCALLALASLAGVWGQQVPDAERYWPRGRGPHFKGVSTTANPPITWSETKNIVWKAPLPGRGNSTPVVLNPIPSPVFEDGVPILMSGFQGNDLKAIRVVATSTARAPRLQEPLRDRGAVADPAAAAHLQRLGPLR